MQECGKAEKMKKKIIVRSPMYAVVRQKETGWLVFESAVGTCDEVYKKAKRLIGKDTNKYEIALYLA